MEEGRHAPVVAGANSSCGALVGVVVRSSEPDVAIRSARVPSVVIGYVKGHLRPGQDSANVSELPLP